MWYWGNVYLYLFGAGFKKIGEMSVTDDWGRDGVWCVPSGFHEVDWIRKGAGVCCWVGRGVFWIQVEHCRFLADGNDGGVDGDARDKACFVKGDCASGRIGRVLARRECANVVDGLCEP